MKKAIILNLFAIFHSLTCFEGEYLVKKPKFYQISTRVDISHDSAARQGTGLSFSSASVKGQNSRRILKSSKISIQRWRRIQEGKQNETSRDLDGCRQPRRQDVRRRQCRGQCVFGKKEIVRPRVKERLFKINIFYRPTPPVATLSSCRRASTASRSSPASAMTTFR